MIVDVGQGPPLVLIPGIQGRWEDLRPAIQALARSFRVLTFSLSGERDSGRRFEPALGFDTDARQVLALLDERRIERATICGISFGGLAAIRFAAAHPAHSAALIVVSTPGPGWRLRARHRVYTRVPWLFAPLFLIESPLRLRREMAATFPSLDDRWRFVRWQLGTLARAPLSPARMAARAQLIADANISRDCSKVTTPTLLVTGERALDRVVSVDGTLAYLTIIAGARHLTLERTGHLGSITTPAAFADMVRAFVERQVPRERLADGAGRATA